jgi:hypothetical protein
MSLTDLVSEARTQDTSRLQFVLGVVFCVIAFVGSTQFGWEYGGSPDPVPAVLGAIACVITVSAVLHARRE